MRDLLRALQRLGADTTRLCDQVGMADPMLRNPAARVSARYLERLLEEAAAALSDPVVGLHAGALAESSGTLFYLLLSSPRLSEGLHRLTRYASDALDTQHLTASVRSGIVTLSIDPGEGLRHKHHVVDYIVTVTLGTLRRSIPAFRAQQVSLSHRAVGPAREYQRTLGCPVYFGGVSNDVCFAASGLDDSPAVPNAAVADHLEQLISANVARWGVRDVGARTRQIMRARLVQGLSVDRSEIARELRVSERTLQRQLARESLTFMALWDQVRAEMSRELLANADLGVAAVAHSVGFVEVASFSRAFARWTGSSPARYRATLGETARQRGDDGI